MTAEDDGDGRERLCSGRDWRAWRRRRQGSRGRQRWLSRTRTREYKPVVGCMPVCNVGRKGLGGDFRKLPGGTV